MSTVPTLAITATFTAEPLEEVLAFWCDVLNRPARIAFAPFNQVFQQLLDPAGLQSSHGSGLNVVVARLEDLGTEDSELERSVGDLVGALRRAAAASKAPYLLAICPASSTAERTRAAAFARAEARIVEAIAPLPRTSVLTPREVLSRYAVTEHEDVQAAALGQLPYTAEYFAALGSAIVRHWHAWQPSPYKAIAADCDGTLWTGVCGEVGASGVEIDGSRKALQQMLTHQQQAGVLICLCSRNNAEDVAAVFEERAADMVITREHIVASRIDWRPKSENLRALAAELGLGLDSFVFLDDDPVVCAEVRQTCPEVLTLQVPPTRLDRFLQHLWPFDRRTRTHEDSQRTTLYRQEVARTREKEASADLDSFFASLNLSVTSAPLTRASLARVAQLTQRTNQFNTTTVRWSEDALADQLARGVIEGLAVDVSDRFGPYGLVGLLLFRVERGVLAVESFLLSCRALGRGVEHQMLNSLGRAAESMGCKRIRILFRDSGRNKPARDFLSSLTRAASEPSPEGVVFTISAHDAAALRFRPGAGTTAVPGVPDADDRPAPAGAAARWPIYQRIATELTDAAAIRRAIDVRRRRARPPLPVNYQPPQTATEQQLIPIWEEVLGVEGIGVHDDFFALGCHSLLATVLVARMTRAVACDLPLEIVFDRPTVAGVAERIDERRVMLASVDELNEVLQSVEGLSDADVAALLGSSAERES